MPRLNTAPLAQYVNYLIYKEELVKLLIALHIICLMYCNQAYSIAVSSILRDLAWHQHLYPSCQVDNEAPEEGIQ